MQTCFLSVCLFSFSPHPLQIYKLYVCINPLFLRRTKRSSSVAPMTTQQAPNTSLNTAFFEAGNSNPPNLPQEIQWLLRALPENQFAQAYSLFVIKLFTYDYL